MFWVLIVMAALPLIMGLVVFVILRRGMHHRLHERREGDGPVIVGADSASWSVVPNDADGTVTPGNLETGGGDFGGGGATGDWSSSESGASSGSGEGGDGGGSGGGGGGSD